MARRLSAVARRLCACLLAIWGLGAALCAVRPAPAFAQDDRAREIFENGRILYAEGRYEPARLAFEEAYRLSGRHVLLYNIASCHEKLGELQAAVDTLNRYRAFARADERDELEQRVAALEAELAAAPVASDAPAPAPSSPEDPAPRPPFGRAGLVTAAVGGGVVVVAGTVALVTHQRGLSLREQGFAGPYRSVQVVNNTSVGVAVVGGLAVATGLVLGRQGIAAGPGRGVPSVALGPRAAALHWSW